MVYLILKVTRERPPPLPPHSSIRNAALMHYMCARVFENGMWHAYYTR